MDGAKSEIALTTKESMVLMCLCLGVGIIYGVVLSQVNDLQYAIGLALSLFLGPGTWFWMFCRFGVRGRERVAFIRRGGMWLNILGSFISLLTVALIYAIRFIK